jgi:hypothetical protein
MPNEPFDSAAKSDLLVSSQKSLKVEESQGRKVVRYRLEPWMQGHTFALDMSVNSSDEVPRGPFRIEYTLGTEFVLCESELPSLRLEEGYSYLKTAQEFDRFDLSLKYIDTTYPEGLKEATLRFGTANQVLQKLIIETPESNFEKAIRHTGQLVADILDAISFLKRLPLSVRSIEVHSNGGKFCRQYRTYSYSPRELTPENIDQAATIPASIKPALRLFREGMSSTRPPYRLLCLYRVREIITKVRQENDKKVLADTIKRDRPSRLLMDNNLTRQYFPTYVGKKVGAFLDHVRSKFRLAIAHGELDEISRLILDPADVRIDHRIDFTNAALEPVIAEMIEDEIAFMARHGLDKPGVLGSGPCSGDPSK